MTNRQLSFFVIFFSLLVLSCRKKTEYSGTVFSRHHMPLPNATMTFAFGHGGKDVLDEYYHISTGANGSFIFNINLRHNAFLGAISVKSDSGNYYKKYNCYNCEGSGTKKNMEIILQ